MFTKMTVKPIKIVVTWQDINHGRLLDCRKCPIARAVHRQLGLECVVDNKVILLGCSDIFARYSYDHVEFKLPLNASKFVSRFDRGNKCRPFTFWLTEQVGGFLYEAN